MSGHKGGPENATAAESVKPKAGLGLTEITEPGWKKAQSTALFRAINPELFIKPNKVVMWTGVVLFSGAVAYIAYLSATKENKKTYVAMDEHETLRTRTRVSRWD